MSATARRHPAGRRRLARSRAPLALTPGPPRGSVAPRPTSAAGGRTMASSGTVMVVDDERFFLTVLGDFVAERLQMKPVLVQDGETAVALAATEPPDLVLLDVMMPGMD